MTILRRIKSTESTQFLLTKLQHFSCFRYTMTTCQDFSKVVLRFGYTIIAAPRFWLGSTAGKSKAVIAIYRFPWGPVANKEIQHAACSSQLAACSWHLHLQLQAASCKLQAARCKLQAARCKLQAASCSCKLQGAAATSWRTCRGSAGILQSQTF